MLDAAFSMKVINVANFFFVLSSSSSVVRLAYSILQIAVKSLLLIYKCWMVMDGSNFGWYGVHWTIVKKRSVRMLGTSNFLLFSFRIPKPLEQWKDFNVSCFMFQDKYNWNHSLHTHRSYGLRNWNSLNHRLNMSRLTVTFCQWINILSNFQLNRISQPVLTWNMKSIELMIWPNMLYCIHIQRIQGPSMLHALQTITIQTNALIEQTHSILRIPCLLMAYKNKINLHEQHTN